MTFTVCTTGFPSFDVEHWYAPSFDSWKLYIINLNSPFALPLIIPTPFTAGLTSMLSLYDIKFGGPLHCNEAFTDSNGQDKVTFES